MKLEAIYCSPCTYLSCEFSFINSLEHRRENIKDLTQMLGFPFRKPMQLYTAEKRILVLFQCVFIYLIMWSCPGNMAKYYPGLREGEGNMSRRPG